MAVLPREIRRRKSSTMLRKLLKPIVEIAGLITRPIRARLRHWTRPQSVVIAEDAFRAALAVHEVEDFPITHLKEIL